MVKCGGNDNDNKETYRLPALSKGNPLDPGADIANFWPLCPFHTPGFSLVALHFSARGPSLSTGARFAAYIAGQNTGE